MGDLIFTLPFLIILFFILAQFLSAIRRVISYLKKELDLTISEADQEIKREDMSMSSDYSESEVKKKIAEAEKESFQKNKERILNKNSADMKRNKKEKNKIAAEISKKKRKKDKQHFSEIFSDYNEVQKAVIYNELLSKPKSLKKK